MAINVIRCTHKREHHNNKDVNCLECEKSFSIPICRLNKYCSPWCARRSYSKNYTQENSPNFKHGKTTDGYKRINKNGKRMLEHRAVMEDKIGRELESNEWVHHRNVDNLDNSPENLAVVLVNHHFTDVSCPNCQFNFLIK